MTAYSITAVQGTFTMTGVALGLTKSIKYLLSLACGTFSMIGNSLATRGPSKSWKLKVVSSTSWKKKTRGE